MQRTDTYSDKHKEEMQYNIRVAHEDLKGGGVTNVYQCHQCQGNKIIQKAVFLYIFHFFLSLYFSFLLSANWPFLFHQEYCGKRTPLCCFTSTSSSRTVNVPRPEYQLAYLGSDLNPSFNLLWGNLWCHTEYI